MSIPANDAISLNAHTHAHQRRGHRRTPSRRSQTLSPPPPSSLKVANIFTQGHRDKSEHLELSGAVNKLSSMSMAVNGDLNRCAHTPNGAPPPAGKVYAPHPPAILDKDKKVVNGDKAKVTPIDWEIPRKTLHSSIGFIVIPLYISHVSAHDTVAVLSTACAIITAVDFVRLRYPRFARLYESVVGFLMRNSEKTKVNGVIWYLLGCIFVISFYPQDIAVVSILILSWCDTAASLFGRLYGSYTPRLPRSMTLRLPCLPTSSLTLPLPFAARKSVAGLVAGVATGTLIATGFWGWLAPLGAGGVSSLPRLVLNSTSDVRTPSILGLGCTAVVTGLFAGVSEAIDIGSLDDNLTLPIIAGGAIYLFFRAVDYFFP